MTTKDQKTPKHLQVGAFGEEIAAKYLENKGFDIIHRNYRKKCGEIDIVAKMGETLHFIEVKSVSRENSSSSVSRVMGEYRPEENVHPAKMKRLTRAIQIYLLEKFPREEPFWEFGIVTVAFNMDKKEARVKFMKNLIL